MAAVSGGSDSLALLLLLHRHLTRTQAPPRLVAVTVDHGLRAESAEEASAVAALCERLGVAHRTLRWTGDKPATGMPAAARSARYALLAEAAADAGADLVLTGHTADDQAETVAMRRMRGDAQGDQRGLAGIAPATLYGNRVWFVRPLLATARADLQDFLRDEDIAWASDPSNLDPRFERARTRTSLSASDKAALLAIARDAAARRVTDGEAAAASIDAHAAMTAPGLVRLGRALFADPDGDAALLAFRMLLACVGGTPHLPDEPRAAALFRRIAEPGLLRATLSGALVDVRRDHVLLAAERRGASAPEPGVLAPFRDLIPSFDLAPARALAALFGAAAIPAPPFIGHEAGDA